MGRLLEGRRVTVVGAGLAGTECALQLAARGAAVLLVEMRPVVSTEVHRGGGFSTIELPLIFLVMFVLMFIAGAGRFSLDNIIVKQLGRKPLQ